MNFGDVRNIVIPEGVVSSIARGGETLWRKLTKDKRELEYIESTGTQWINTGIFPTDNTIKLEVKIAYSSTTTGQLMGAGVSGNERFNFGIESRRFRFGFGGSWFNANSEVLTADTEPHIWVLDANTKTGSIDGVEETTTNTYTPGGSHAIALFARGVGSSAESGNRAKGKLYYAKVWNKGALVRDLIPVIDRNDRPCMYDRVTDKLFYNQGTGEFIAGRQIHPVEYLESTGTQYVDTGFTPNQDTRVLTEHFYTKQPANNGFIYGAGVSATSRAFEMYTWGSNWNSPYGNTNIVLTPQSTSLFISDKITIDKNKNNLTIQYADGTVQTKSGEYVTFEAPRNMWLFAINRGSFSVSLAADCVQLCYCKIFDNDTLVRDYIPAHDENGVGFMFDRVTHTIFDNAGNGEFLYG